MSLKWPLFIVCALSFYLSACGINDSVVESAEGAEALLVHPNAKDVSHSKVEGTLQVRYSVVEKYPANAVIKWLSAELEQKAWKPLDHDFMDPRIKLSHITGWTDFIDAQKPLEDRVHQWLANWKHPSGSVVRYQLQYRYPKTVAPDLNKLEIVGIFIPASLVKQAETFPK